jgi:hypothetical protein
VGFSNLVFSKMNAGGNGVGQQAVKKSCCAAVCALWGKSLSANTSIMLSSGISFVKECLFFIVFLLTLFNVIF